MRSAVFLALATLTVAVQGEHYKHHYHHDAAAGDTVDNADGAEDKEKWEVLISMIIFCWQIILLTIPISSTHLTNAG